MRCRGVIAFMALCFGLTLQSMPADAQHHASKQKAQRPKSDAELIASATSAALLSLDARLRGWVCWNAANCRPCSRAFSRFLG